MDKLLGVLEVLSAQTVTLIVALKSYYKPSLKATSFQQKYISFRCEIDSGEAALYIKICSSARAKLLFEMLPGYHTQNFVSEIFRLTDATAASAKKGQNKSFAWIEKYTDSIKGNTVGPTKPPP